MHIQILFILKYKHITNISDTHGCSPLQIKMKSSDNFKNIVGHTYIKIKIVSYYLSWSLEAKPDFDVSTLGFALLNLVGLGSIEDFELLLESLFTLEQPCKTSIKRLNTKARTKHKSNLGRGYQ